MEEQTPARSGRFARECVTCEIVYVNVPSDATMPQCHRCNRPIIKIRTEPRDRWSA